jgi:hypothetical protein
MKGETVVMQWGGTQNVKGRAWAHILGGIITMRGVRVKWMVKDAHMWSLSG